MHDNWFQLELTRPALLVGLVVLPVLAYFFYRSLVDLPRGQQIVSLSVRILIVLLVVFSLAGLTLLSPTGELYVLFAVDESMSVGDESREPVNQFLEQAVADAKDDRFRILNFAAAPGTLRSTWDDDQTGEAAAKQEREEREDEPIDKNGTDIAAAIELATASIPPHYVPRIVLLTDGNETTGHALKSALSGGVEIDTVPLKTRSDPEIQLSAVHVPAQVAQGEPFYVEVVVDSNQIGEAQIDVYRGPHKVVSEREKIIKGENRFRFRQSIDRDRLVEFTARVSGSNDTLLDNNSESGLVFTAGKPRVLLVESVPELAQHIEWALEEEDILVDTRPPQGMPDSLADLQNYELLMISNVPATELSARKMDVIRTYVRDLGGGLIMLGGDQSFGLGGYYKTALEEALPVRSDFEKEKEKPSLGMVLVIDKSGSMGGQKIELAKDAAKAAVELLGPRDMVGVIAFEGSSYWVSEMHPCSDKSFLLDRISMIEAGGGTNLYPAMVAAYEALQSTAAKLKHVIILTDGISAPGDFEGISRSMAASRMTVSTVGVGQGADQNLLEEIARIGRGRYYFTDDPLSIPQIFAKETMSASKSAINEEPFLPQVIRPSDVFSQIAFDTAPFLLGYVITRPKPTSEVVLAAESGDPLLVWWRYGLGMSVAFTSDAKSRWAAEWLTWPGYNRFWSQLVRHAMRKSEAKGFVVEVERNGDRAAITVDSSDPAGNFLNKANTELTLIDPQLRNRKIEVSQVAPGRYSAQFETPFRGAYHLELSQKHHGQILYRQSRGLVVGYADELRLRPTNEKLLKTIAQSTGGKYNPQPADVFAPSDTKTATVTPLWPYLTIAVLLLFLADVALRRIDFSVLLAAWVRKIRIASGRRSG